MTLDVIRRRDKACIIEISFYMEKIKNTLWKPRNQRKRLSHLSELEENLFTGMQGSGAIFRSIV